MRRHCLTGPTGESRRHAHAPRQTEVSVRASRLYSHGATRRAAVTGFARQTCRPDLSDALSITMNTVYGNYATVIVAVFIMKGYRKKSELLASYGSACRAQPRFQRLAPSVPGPRSRSGKPSLPAWLFPSWPQQVEIGGGNPRQVNRQCLSALSW